jgi:hypothetical protein
MELLKKMFEEAKKNMKPILDSVFQVLGSVLKEVIKSMFITVLDAILSLIPGYDLAKKGLKALSSGFSEAGSGGVGVGDYEVDALGNSVGVSPETPESSVSVETTKPPPADNAKLARDWAWSIMSGQTDKSAPASIKDQVDSIISSDTSLKQQAEKYKADMAKRREDDARRQSETAKPNQEKPAEEKPKEQKPAAVPAQESPASTANVLNTQMAQLIRASLETAEYTKRTASILASKGNLLNG